MKEKIYILFIIALLQMGFVSNYQLACAETLPTEPNHPIKKQSPDKFHKPIIDSNKQNDSNQPTILLKDANSSRLSIDELQVEIYKEGLECFRREMDNYKWIINYSLIALGVIVALAGLFITLLSSNKKREITQAGKKQIEELDKEAGKQKEVSVLWNEGNNAYNEKDYDAAIKIWQKIDEEYKLKSRPFFNNWGSSLLNLAKQRTGDEREKLLLEAAEKYKKAENFTRGIAAYSLASICSLLDREDECKKWLEVAKETGRMLPKAKFSQNYDFEKMWGEAWFEQFKNDLPE